MEQLERRLGRIARAGAGALALALAVGAAGIARAQSPEAGTAQTAAAAPAAPAGGSGEIIFGNGFYDLKADDVDFNDKTGDFKINKRFTASRPDKGSDISADRAYGNSKQKVMHASGNVIVHQDRPLNDRGQKASELTQKPSTLTCDVLDADEGRHLYVANSNVHFTQVGGRDMTSDKATLDDVAHILRLEGHVHLRDADQFADADIVQYNTDTGESHMEGHVMLRAPVATPTPGPPATPKPPKKKK